MQKTLSPSTKFYRTNWTVAHGELFHRCRGLLLDYSGMEGASSRFLIELWTVKAGVMTLGFVGHL